MTVVNFNYPKFKYTIATTGQPGVGYKLFTYEEGTSTKKTTWTSLAKTAANTNPIILDANGECDVWIDGNYKFVLAPPTDTDPPASPVWTYDAIRSTDTAAAASLSGASIPSNGSFETDTNADGIPDDWTLVEYTGGTVAIDSTVSSHGANSLKFTSTGSGGGSASTNSFYEVEAGDSVGIRFTIISANANTHNKVEISWYTAAQLFLSTTAIYDDAATNPTSLTRKYLSATAPATAKYAKIILTGVAPDSVAHSTTNFDNIELETIVTPNVDGVITATAAEINVLDGIPATLTSTEIGYLDGVTSSIQSQMNTIKEGLSKRTVYTSSGTWTKPSTIVRIKVVLVGGGGGGGGARDSAFDIRGGAGGIGGICNNVVIEAASLNAIETVTVGAAGSAGVPLGAGGGTGGTSSFGAHCSATGGTGGADASAGGANGSNGTQTGDSYHIYSYFLGENGAFLAAYGQGNSGIGYGGGGSGAYGGNSIAYNGGAGAPGIVIVEEFY